MNAHTVIFDRLAYLDRLKAAGVDEGVARAHADGLDQALRESVATKADIEKLESVIRGEMASLRADMEKSDATIRSDTERLGTSLRADMGKLETSLRADMGKIETSLRADTEKLETSLRSDIGKIETSLRADMEKMETRLDARITKEIAGMTDKVNASIHRGIALIGALIAASSVVAHYWK